MIAVGARYVGFLAAFGWASTLGLSLAAFLGVPVPNWIGDGFLIALLPIWVATIVLTFSWAGGRWLTPRIVWLKAFEDAPRWLRYLPLVAMLYVFIAWFSQVSSPDITGQRAMMSLASAMYAFTLSPLWAASHRPEERTS